MDSSGASRARGQGSGRGPAAWDGFGFFGEINEAAPCGVSLPGLPADPGRAFQRFPALPHGTSLLRLPALPCASAPSGGAGRWMVRGVLGDPGCYGLAGRGALAAWQGSGRAHARGAGSGFFGGLSPPCCALRRFPAVPAAHLCVAPMLCAFGTSGPHLSVLPCASLGVGARGVFGESRRCGLGGRGTPAA